MYSQVIIAKQIPSNVIIMWSSGVLYHPKRGFILHIEYIILLFLNI